VHRDLKPENVFITRDGVVKILDFGLAKLAQPETAGATLPPTATGYTAPGIVMGTVGYMSPEQVRGEATDHRSDIFAFGAILYEMITGQRAFARQSAAETLSAILRDEPALTPSSSAAAIPAFSRIVAHCLEKRAADRFQSARDLAFALRALSAIESGPVHASPSRARRWPVVRMLPWLITAVAILAALAVVLVKTPTPPDTQPVRRVTIALPSAEPPRSRSWYRSASGARRSRSPRTRRDRLRRQPWRHAAPRRPRSDRFEGKPLPGAGVCVALRPTAGRRVPDGKRGEARRVAGDPVTLAEFAGTSATWTERPIVFADFAGNIARVRPEGAARR
jgi:serine/threonine protein kinase